MAKSRGRPTFLIEHYRPDLEESDFLEAAHRVAEVAERMSSEGRYIELLHCTIVPEEGSAFCVVTAADVTLVEEAYSLAGVEYERLMPAVESPKPR